MKQGFKHSEDELHTYAGLLKEGYHRIFFGVKVKTVKLIEGRRYRAAIYACPNHTDDGIHSDHGYLDTLDNPLGPP